MQHGQDHPLLNTSQHQAQSREAAELAAAAAAPTTHHGPLGGTLAVAVNGGHLVGAAHHVLHKLEVAGGEVGLQRGAIVGVGMGVGKSFW